MDFSDEQLKEFMQNCQIEDFGRKQQKKWDEKGGLVRTAIQFLAFGAETHPGIRAIMQVSQSDNDVEKVRKDWANIERLINAYLDIFKETLMAIEKMKERKHGE